MVIQVPEEVSLYLEKLFIESTSAKELLCSLLEDGEPLTHKHYDLLHRYMEAHYAWLFCFITLSEALLPEDADRNEVSFSFDDKSFIFNQQGGETMSVSTFKPAPKTAVILPEERDKLRDAFSDYTALENLVTSGVTAVTKDYLEANRRYMMAWDDILAKYFPEVNTSSSGTATWSCEFRTCVVTVVE